MLERQLPPAPDYLVPAAVAEPDEGLACVAVAAEERAGRVTNEKIIKAVKGDWEALRRDYGGARP